MIFYSSFYRCIIQLYLTHNCHLLSANVDGQDAVPVVPPVDLVHRRGPGGGRPVPQEVEGMAKDWQPYMSGRI